MKDFEDCADLKAKVAVAIQDTERDEFEQITTKEEEEALVNTMRKGGIEGIAARETLIKSLMNMAAKAASCEYGKLFSVDTIRSNISKDDLIQEAYIGVITAVDKYEIQPDSRLSTYAAWWVNNKIKSYVSQFSRTVRIPESQISIMVGVDKAAKTLEELLGREATPDELHRYLEREVSVDKIIEALALIKNEGRANIDEQIEEELAIDAPTIEENYEEADMMRVIADTINNLPPKERIIINYSFGINGCKEATGEQISEILLQNGITNKNNKAINFRKISKAKFKALEKLREELKDYA